MAGILYVVATPIGNLEDVTLRALRVLRDVSVIAAEDTRRTARLLQHYSISTRTTSLHEHNEHEKAAKLVERLLAGESIALVSDAGTPVVSDPGQTLVALARDAGVRVEAIPGPSAVLAAISASGLPAASFTFLGFPPSRPNARAEWFERLRGSHDLLVFFEAPHRVLDALKHLTRVFDQDMQIAVGRELTKAHEELVVQPISRLIERFSEPKGEFTFLIPSQPPSSDSPQALPPIEDLRQELGRIAQKGGVSRRAAVKTLAGRYGVAVNELYELLRPQDDGGQKT
jgi:16S rRNA (cytidine1402-2'-O)-methyltransferase